jgi:RsiW-degrading membrane proteinase PrsW (M82 family)
MDSLIATTKAPGRRRILAPLIALAGGVFGIIGALYNELFHGSFLVAFVGAPIIEEILKPAGVYFLLAKWPDVVRNRFYTAFLASLGGLAFAIVENIIYFTVYIHDPSRQLIIWRYTVCLGLHIVCSFIFGLGINQKLMASIKGETKLLSYGKRFFITAMIIHSGYNIFAVFAESIFGFKA